MTQGQDSGAPHAPSPPRDRLAWGVFVLAIVIRWLYIGGLGGDDHWSLWTAATFLKGDTPFREFVDMGNPLHWFVSAVAQWLVGYRIIGEVLVGVVLGAWAITLAYLMARQASGSKALALILAVSVMVLVTVAKLYSYPKIFVYPLGLWLCWQYIDRPTVWNAVWLATGVAVAFGYRHDHGAYVGVAATVAVLAAHWSAGWTRAAGSLLRFAGIGVLIFGPYFIWIQVNEGLVAYFRERITFARQLDDAGRRAVPWVADQKAPDSWFGFVTPPPARVAVSWDPGLSDADRHAAEQRHALTSNTTPDSPWRSYLITDSSESNLRVLMGDPRVRLSEGIAGSFRLEYGPAQPEVESPEATIVWSPAVTTAMRTVAERQYHLVEVAGSSAGGGARYVLADTSGAVLTGLATDRRVTRIDGLRPLIHPVVVRLEVPAIAGPSVAIRWKADVTEEVRKQREARYGLVAAREEPAGSRWWRYEIQRPSEDNVTALATDEAGEDRGGISETATPGRYRVREPQPAGGRVLIKWDETVDDVERTTLEREYSLQPMSAATSMREYELLDTSRDRIRALVTDPQAAATSGLDRVAFRLSEEPLLTSLGREHRWLRFRLLPRYVHEANAGVFLYYIEYTLPFIALLLLAFDAWQGRRNPRMAHEPGKMLVAAVMAALVSVALLRKLGYFPDHADLAIVLAGWVLSRAWSLGRLRRARRGCVVALASLVALSGWSYADGSSLVSRANFGGGIAGGFDALGERLQAQMTSPPIDSYAPKDSIGDRAVIRYFYECTRPEDRIWLTTDVYTIPYYTERRVVGHIFWGLGFRASADVQRETIALLDRDPVPFIFGVGGARPLQFLEAYDQVHDYVSRRYTETHAILQDHLDREGRILWLAVDSRRVPVRTYESLGLPCFR